MEMRVLDIITDRKMKNLKEAPSEIERRKNLEKERNGSKNNTEIMSKIESEKAAAEKAE